MQTCLNTYINAYTHICLPTYTHIYMYTTYMLAGFLGGWFSQWPTQLLQLGHIVIGVIVSVVIISIVVIWYSAPGHMVIASEFVCDTYWYTSLNDAWWNSFVYVAFDGHMCSWQLYVNSIVIKVQFVVFCVICTVMWTTVAAQCDICVQCGRYFWLGAYADDVKCVYISAPVHIIDCSGLIWGINIDILV